MTPKEENGSGAFRPHSAISAEGLNVPGSLLGTKARASSPSRPFWSEVRHKSTKLTNVDKPIHLCKQGLCVACPGPPRPSDGVSFLWLPFL